MPPIPPWQAAFSRATRSATVLTVPQYFKFRASMLVIDTRSPSEIRNDHLPGAIALPVLLDDERHDVGTLYKQVSAQTASFLGAPLILKRIADYVQHLATSLTDSQGQISYPVQRERLATAFRQASASVNGGELILDPRTHHVNHSALVQGSDGSGFPIVVYCRRGGLRSRSVVEVLQHCFPGHVHPVVQLEGGYQAYRKFIGQNLSQWFGPGEGSTPFQPFLISGKTGTGKSLLLRLLRQQTPPTSGPVLDLEQLANHRGSVLGGHPGMRSQPSQPLFESRIVSSIADQQQDNSNGLPQPLWIEDESYRVGEKCTIPYDLYQAMRSPRAPRISIEAPLDARVQYIVQDYRDLIEEYQRAEGIEEQQKTVLYHAIHNVLLKRHVVDSRTQDALREALRQQDFHELVRLLLEHHYDAAYVKKDPNKSPAVLRMELSEITERQMLDVALPALNEYAAGWTARTTRTDSDEMKITT